MSMGPSGAEQEVKETPIQRTKIVAGGILKHFRENPAERLFYFGMALLIVGLPFRVEFPLAYYGVLALLGLILLCQFALRERAKYTEHAD